MKKFEQISSDGHQMPLAGVEAGMGGSMSGGRTVRSNASWVMVTW